jgi:hypothetical protein
MVLAEEVTIAGAHAAALRCLVVDVVLSRLLDEAADRLDGDLLLAGTFFLPVNRPCEKGGAGHQSREKALPKHLVAPTVSVMNTGLGVRGS